MADSNVTRVGLVGACGRMGQMLVRRILATEGMTVSSAFDLVNVGKDIGEVVGVGALGVPVSDSKDLAQVLKDSKTDVLLDFTIAKATAVNAPIAAAAGVNLIIGTTGLSDEVKQAIAAYTGRDVETAHAVVNLDDEVDDLFDQVKRELIEEVAENKDEADSSIDFIIIAKYLERVADHAVNIAQWAIFCVTGEL